MFNQTLLDAKEEVGGGRGQTGSRWKGSQRKLGRRERSGEVADNKRKQCEIARKREPKEPSSQYDRVRVQSSHTLTGRKGLIYLGRIQSMARVGSFAVERVRVQRDNRIE